MGLKITSYTSKFCPRLALGRKEPFVVVQSFQLRLFMRKEKAGPFKTMCLVSSL